MDLVTHFLMFQTGIQLLEQLKIMKIVFKVEGPTLIGALNSFIINKLKREMWDLINVNDSKTLTADQLETGMGTVTRSDDFFDCHPAIQTAFKYTKVITNWGKIEKDEETNNKRKESIDFDEFKTFLRLLRLYYSYCQVHQL